MADISGLLNGWLAARVGEAACRKWAAAGTRAKKEVAMRWIKKSGFQWRERPLRVRVNEF